ncbi:c-type cytochrome [Hwanghaeella sp.]|uniref:c-type cytochrome n=1 Tax=Hwanghaeella sp. TaxID=2605943 RepID=UPI003CCBDD55
MTFRNTLTAAATALALVAGSAVVAHASSQDDTIKQRQQAMKDIGAQMKVIKGYLGGSGTAEDVAAGAAKINMLIKSTGDLFPANTAPGASGVTVETEALPKIWEDPEGFAKAAAVLEAESAKLEEVAASDDPEAIGAQFGAMAKNGCGGCHKVYRVKK